MPRAYWRGYLKLALVTCPIGLIPATTDRDTIHFHKLNRETGNRLRMRMVDAKTEDVVDRDDTVMGYEVSKGKYVTVEDEELDRLKIESSDIISIERVVPLDEVDWLYWEKPYIVEPDTRGKGAKGTLEIFSTVREALARKDMVGLGRAVIGRRERPVMVRPRGKGMMLLTLRGPDEIRKPEKAFHNIGSSRIDKDNLSMAEALLKKLEGRLDEDLFQDRYQDALHKLVAAKRKGRDIVYPEEPEKPSNVVDITAALKASLKETQRRGRAPSRKPRARSMRKRAKKAA